MSRCQVIRKDTDDNFEEVHGYTSTPEPVSHCVEGRLPETGVSVGVDLGLIDLSVLSDGARITALRGSRKKNATRDASNASPIQGRSCG
jgi:hypothetical protein